jgi:hypothetical protein
LIAMMGSPPWLSTMFSLWWTFPWLIISAARNSVSADRAEHTNCSYNAHSENASVFSTVLGSSTIQLAIRAGIIRVECFGLSNSELGLNNKSILRTNHFVYLPSLWSRVASNKFRLWHLVAF